MGTDKIDGLSDIGRRYFKLNTKLRNLKPKVNLKFEIANLEI